MPFLKFLVGLEQFPEGQDEGTFRHPLPPGNIPRPRIPVQQVLVRAPLRQVTDPRIQGVSHFYVKLASSRKYKDKTYM